MRINYKTHPILKLLEKGDLQLVNRHPDDIIGYEYLMANLRLWFEKYLPYFKEVTFLSIPFIEASAKSQKKLLDLYSDMHENDLGDVVVTGSWIAGPGITMIYRKFNKQWGKVETAMFGFQNDGYPIFSLVENEHTQGGNFGEGCISPLFAKYNNIPQDKCIEWLQYKVSDMIVTQMFKSYAEVETKVLPAGKKIKGISCKHLNETKLDITYLDSKWFTNLHVSGAFNVRGHFRMQPKKKNGEWTKEIIWIKDFQKEGYTAPARKLKEDIN